MYRIKVYSEDQSLLKYLGYEGTNIEDNTYEFSSPDRIIDVLTRYLLFEIKQEALVTIIPPSETSSSEIESFLMFVPSDYEEMWRKRIHEIVYNYIHNEEPETLYMDGFKTFRMHDIKTKYFNYLKEEYECFLDMTEPPETLDGLIEFMNSQPLKSEEIIIETKENGHVLIKEEGICLYIETEGEQENLVVQSIYASPKKVKVIDEHDILRKELVIVLKQIFGKNLVFERNQKTP
ncbi:hypothetical protein U8V72_18390 [Priestia filamentosa]|uniref:hypothetical protein n=1 Tax=Priestia filamentosa TaxID=1402861 RepID=UPI000589048F